MSTHLVPVCAIDAVMPHPNADKLEIALVKGWQCVVPKGAYVASQKVVYFPPDTILPVEVSDRFGVTKYLSNGRIRCAKLRGEPSFGLIQPLDDMSIELDTNVAERYGATKYEPPLRAHAGDAVDENSRFPRYTDIENLRHFPNVIEQGEMVTVSEKLHGSNCRVGVINGEQVAGSKRLQRRRPDDEAIQSNTYWSPWTIESVRTLLEALGDHYQQAVLFGEVYGPGVQKGFIYGEEKPSFRAFDLLIDGNYMDADDFQAVCSDYGVPTVPILATIPFNMDVVKKLSDGKTTLMGEDGHIREGVVVKPMKERTHSKVGRVALKYVSDAYLLGDSDTTDA